MGFMGSLGACMAKDCFCGEEISTNAQHREKLYPDKICSFSKQIC